MYEELREKFNKDGSELRNVQLRMLEMMREIDRICQENNICYWLSFGSLLGAVRHGGFIPWDDDIDIEMTMDDARRFAEIAEKQLPPHLKLHAHQNDRFFFFPFLKVRDMNSCITEVTGVDKYYRYRGASIDIFPMRKSSALLHRIAYQIQLNCLIRPAKYLPFKWFHTFLSGIYQIVRLTYKGFGLIDRLAGCKDLRTTYGSTKMNPGLPEEVIFPVKQMDFEGVKFNVPHSPDIYLKKLYGDYMRLPDLNKIEIHAQHIEFL
jgi:lipopolysaccharide cholinephosphotransferase